MSYRQQPRSMPGAISDDDAVLRARVRTALEVCEASRPPPFDRLWRNATQASTNPPRGWGRRALTGPRLALAGVGCSALAVALFLSLQSAPPAPDADYQLALEVTLAYGRPSPADLLAADLPESVARGLPALPGYRYPLLPKETPL